MNEAQADSLNEIDPQLISLAKMRKPDDFEGELNQLIQDFHLKKLTHQQVASLRTTRDSGFQLQRPVMIFLIWHLSKEKFMTKFCNFRDRKKDAENNESDKLEFLKKF